MKTFTLILALSLAAAAQTTSSVSGVGLSGKPGDPVIENHAGKPIIASMTLSTPGGEPTRVRQRFFVHAGDAVLDGASVKVGQDRRAKGDTPIISAQLIAVIFADGEFRGEDRHEFQHDAEKYFVSIREAFAMAMAGEWDKLRAKLKLSDPDDMLARAAAFRLLYIHDQGGDAVKSLQHYGNLPASTWKSLPTANLPRFLGGILEALAGWMRPIVAHAQTTITNTMDYDYAYSFCQTWIFGSDPPCPDPGGSTPWVGKTGSCGGNPVLTIGITAEIGIDDFDYPQVTNQTYLGNNSTYLYVYGNCKDVFFNPQNIESWTYRIRCDNILVEVYDSSGTFRVCGADVKQYPFH